MNQIEESLISFFQSSQTITLSLFLFVITILKNIHRILELAEKFDSSKRKMNEIKNILNSDLSLEITNEIMKNEWNCNAIQNIYGYYESPQRIRQIKELQDKSNYLVNFRNWKSIRKYVDFCSPDIKLNFTVWNKIDSYLTLLFLVLAPFLWPITLFLIKQSTAPYKIKVASSIVVFFIIILWTLLCAIKYSSFILAKNVALFLSKSQEWCVGVSLNEKSLKSDKVK